MDANRPATADTQDDLVAQLALARTAREPGPDTEPGPAVRPWPGERHPLPAATPGVFDLDRLLRLSLAAHDETGRLRPAPSAGGCHPVDVQLAVGQGCALPPGTYGYDPLRHQVHRLPGAPTRQSAGVSCQLYLSPDRTRGHYDHRALPLALLDAGHTAGALALAADVLGLPAATVGLDGRYSGLADAPLATVELSPTGGTSVGNAQLPLAAEVLLSRRSAEPPLTGALQSDLVRELLSVAQHAAQGVLGWCVATGGVRPELLELDGEGELRRYAAGDARPTLAVWAARQGWVGDSGAILLGYGCPDDADATLIRRSHLRAGYAVHHALLLATAHGLRSRPLGAWQQADLGASVGRTPGQEWVVHGLALGDPRTDPRTASDPAAPAAPPRSAPEPPTGRESAP